MPCQARDRETVRPIIERHSIEFPTRHSRCQARQPLGTTVCVAGRACLRWMQAHSSARVFRISAIHLRACMIVGLYGRTCDRTIAAMSMHVN